LKAENLNAVITSLGSMVGGGTLDDKNNLNFNLVATVESSLLANSGSGAGGALGGVLGGGATNCKNGGIKVPLQVRGTTANPKIVPDVGGAAASLLKSELTCGGGSAGSLTNTAKGLAGGGSNTTNTINQLGGLLGKKPKP